MTVLLEFPNAKYALVSEKIRFRVEVPGSRVSPLLWDDAGFNIADKGYDDYYCFQFFPDDGYAITQIDADIDVLPLKTNIFAVKKASGEHELKLSFTRRYRYAVYEMTDKKNTLVKEYEIPDALVVTQIGNPDNHYLIDHIECHDMERDEDIPFDSFGQISPFLGGDQLVFRMPRFDVAIVVHKIPNPKALFVEVDLSQIEELFPRYCGISNGNPDLAWDIGSKRFPLEKSAKRYPFVQGDTLLLTITTYTEEPLELHDGNTVYEALDVRQEEECGHPYYVHRFWPIEAQQGLTLKIVPKNGI